MQLKFKAVIITVVLLAAVAIIFFNGAEEAPEAESPLPGEPVTVFRPNANPREDFMSALEAGRPILLEFYARY